MTEQKKKNESEIVEFDDYAPGDVIEVPLSGLSRKNKPYRVIHKLRIPDNKQLRTYNNALSSAEQTSGRRQRKNQTLTFKMNGSGAAAQLWDQVVVKVIGYPGGTASVPLSHKELAISEILPDLGFDGEPDDQG